MDIANKDRVIPEIALWADELAAIRRETHASPELGFDTKNTCARILKHLRAWGIEADGEAVRGGVIAVVRGNRPGAAIALRADIDALPMDDCSGLPWQSRIAGRAHACGHDGHMTWLLGTLRCLQEKNDFPGTVVGLFQPAEECGGGAPAVIASGVFEKYAVREVYGAHDDPFIDRGSFGFKAGPFQASSDEFWVTLKGVGTHGGRPHQGTDPIPAAALLVQQLQTVVTRKVNPVEPAVLSVCSMNAGQFEAVNVVPAEAKLSGTVRTYSDAVRDQVEREFRAMVNGIAAASGCTAEIVYDRSTPSVINDPGLTKKAIALARELFGEDRVLPDLEPLMGAEDFAEYQRVVPGVILRVGIRDAAHQAVLHNPAFDFNDEVIPAACTLFVAIARSRLEALSA